MPGYHVTFPIKGTATFYVEARNEEEARVYADAMVDDGEDGDVEWEYFEDERTGDNVDVIEATQSEGTEP